MKNKPRQRIPTYQSSGHEVIVRGTARQIVQRYEELAKQAGNIKDTVVMHQHLQQAEHYRKEIRR